MKKFLAKNDGKWSVMLFALVWEDLERWVPIINALENEKIKIVPSQTTRDGIRREKENIRRYKGNFRRYPLTHPYVIDEMKYYILEGGPLGLLD